jgi:hypothetical protein
VERRQLADEAPVGLLREGRGDVARPQSGLDVENRLLVVEGRQGGGEGRRRVALDGDRIRGEPPDRLVGSLEGPRRHLGERLPGLVDVEVQIGLDVEEGMDLIEHFAMLPGDNDAGVESGILCEGLHERRHLDGLGPSPVDEHHPDRRSRRHISLLVFAMCDCDEICQRPLRERIGSRTPECAQSDRGADRAPAVSGKRVPFVCR